MYLYKDASREEGFGPAYYLAPDNAKNRWFYTMLRNGADSLVQTETDAHLNLTNVWINVKIRQGDNVLGVVGTGINLDAFLKESVGIAQNGISNFFIDSDLNLQLASDASLIDYAFQSKAGANRTRVNVLLDRAEDVEKLQALVKRMQAGDTKNSVIDVVYHGARHWLGVAYLPEIGWFDLTFMEQGKPLFAASYIWIPIGFITLFLCALVLLGTMLHRWILKPIYKLNRSVKLIQSGEHVLEPVIEGGGEINSLARSFWGMIKIVLRKNEELEQMVRERTEDLRRITETDPLTDLLNRRGMLNRLDTEIARLERQGRAFGLLLIDVDHFKSVNDIHGHGVGDLALCATAVVLGSTKRRFDFVARWGGEEFLMLLPECSMADLHGIAERIRKKIEELSIDGRQDSFSVTVSIGLHLVDSPQSAGAMLNEVDIALYAAKDAGRNCVRSTRDIKPFELEGLAAGVQKPDQIK
jgi:diguanylate cyclase (GGDEF)-like protein